MIYLRNLHPKQTVYVPVSPGWCRMLRPGVTSALPSAALHTPAARALLTRQLITVVDGAAWNAETRQARALKAEMARAIAKAEQAEFDKLRKGVVISPRRKGKGPGGKGRYSRWIPERKARFGQLWRAGASVDVIANEVGMGRANVWATVQRFGLPGRRGDTTIWPDKRLD